MADVVVADLDADGRELTARLLHAARHRVYQAADGVALQTLLRISPAPLVVVVQLDALEMVRDVLSLLPPAPPPSAQLEAPLAAEPIPWALRHAFILVSAMPRVRLLARALVRRPPVFARHIAPLRTAHDAVLLLSLINEAEESLGVSPPSPAP